MMKMTMIIRMRMSMTKKNDKKQLYPRLRFIIKTYRNKFENILRNIS